MKLLHYPVLLKREIHTLKSGTQFIEASTLSSSPETRIYYDFLANKSCIDFPGFFEVYLFSQFFLRGFTAATLPYKCFWGWCFSSGPSFANTSLTTHLKVFSTSGLIPHLGGARYYNGSGGTNNTSYVWKSSIIQLRAVRILSPGFYSSSPGRRSSSRSSLTLSMYSPMG